MKEIILNLTKKQKTILAIVVFIILFVTFIYIYKNIYNSDENREILIDNSAQLENELNSNKSDEVNEKNNTSILNKEDEKVVVHVIGEVNNPGVVTLKEGARIIDAINEAGGKTEEADLSKVNLAYVIEDGTQIYIPRINENLNNVELMTQDAGSSIVVNTQEKDEDNNNKNAKVNINTASKEKLETLPGIGETTAQKIIDYRESNGKFNSIEDLKNVSGIGDAKFNSLKDKITV